MRDDGWWVARAAGSLGDADIIALKAGYRPRLIESKANKAGGPYKNFGPTARSELRAAAKIAGAEAWLCYWPARATPRWIREVEWPLDNGPSGRP